MFAAPPTDSARPVAAVATRSFSAFLEDLSLGAHMNALNESGFDSIASIAALNPESTADLGRLPASIPFLNKKKMIFRAAIETPQPPVSLPIGVPLVTSASSRSAKSATLRPTGAKPPPPPPVSELTNPRKPKPPPPVIDPQSIVNDRLALLSHPAPPLPPSPVTVRRDTAGDVDHAPAPPSAALKKDMLRKLKQPSQSADDLSDSVRPPAAELTRAKSGQVPTVARVELPRALSPPPPTASDELAVSPRRHHHHQQHQSSPTKSSRREKSSKEKSSSSSLVAKKATAADEERPTSTSPPAPEVGSDEHKAMLKAAKKAKLARVFGNSNDVVDRPTSPPVVSASTTSTPAEVDTEEYKSMIKAAKKAKLARIFGARPASNVIDAEVAALATRQLAPDDQSSEDHATATPPPKSTSPGGGGDDADEARHALVLKQRKKSKLEKVFGVRPASFLLSKDGKGDELPALLRSAEATATADDESSTLSDDFDADADEKRRANSRLTLQIQVPEHKMYKTMDFPAEWTIAEALVAIRSKIPALSDQSAFVMTRTVDGTDVPLRTTQSLRVFSKTEANVVKLCSMSSDIDAISAAGVPEGPRHWEKNPVVKAPLTSSGRMAGLLRKASPDIQSTAPKLMAVLLDPELNARFDLFLRHRHAEESLRCWGDIQEYKQLTSQTTRVALAKAIYDKYVRRDAIDEVNLNDTVRREVQARRRIAAVDLFETLEDALVDLMRERYLEFLKSIGF